MPDLKGASCRAAVQMCRTSRPCPARPASSPDNRSVMQHGEARNREWKAIFRKTLDFFANRV